MLIINGTKPPIHQADKREHQKHTKRVFNQKHQGKFAKPYSARNENLRKRPPASYLCKGGPQITSWFSHTRERTRIKTPSDLEQHGNSEAAFLLEMF